MNRKWKVNKMNKKIKINSKMKKTRRRTINYKMSNNLMMAIKWTQNLVENKERMKKYRNTTNTESRAINWLNSTVNRKIN